MEKVPPSLIPSTAIPTLVNTSRQWCPDSGERKAGINKFLLSAAYCSVPSKRTLSLGWLGDDSFFAGMLCNIAILFGSQDYVARIFEIFRIIKIGRTCKLMFKLKLDL